MRIQKLISTLYDVRLKEEVEERSRFRGPHFQGLRRSCIRQEYPRTRIGSFRLQSLWKQCQFLVNTDDNAYIHGKVLREEISLGRLDLECHARII